MGLRHAVITSVARDDLNDGGANHFRETIQAVRKLNPGIVMEVLVPDFGGREESIGILISAAPEIFNHNVETVRRLTPTIRSRATYERSLRVLRFAKEHGGDRLYTKSGLMLGLGETAAEVLEAMRDLRTVSCDLITLGQYLQPTREHLAVAEYISPAQFETYASQARALGFRHVFSGPLVRSSYHAEAFGVESPVPGARASEESNACKG
jgi:lipoic acid synthetase